MSDLPKMNTELAHDIVDWLFHKAGTRPDIPAWYQSTWAIKFHRADALRHMAHTSDYNTEFWSKEAVKDENFCGTAFCASGMALHMTDNLVLNKYGGYELPDTVIGFNETVSLDGVYGNLWVAAGAAVLGLTYDEALQLFRGTNTKEMIRDYLNRFAADRGLEETF